MRPTTIALLLVLVSLAGTGTATAEAAPEPTSLGQALVGFHPGFLTVVAGDHLGGLPVLDTIPQGHVAVVEADDLGDVRAAVSGVPGVAYVEDDPVKVALVVPNDSQYSSQYGPAMMGAPAAWGAAGYGSSAITIAIVDSGIRATHEDLAANYVGGYDYSNGDSDPNDDCGHGTHVAGTAGAVTNNGKGVAGMSQASIVMQKALSSDILFGCSGSASDIAQAIYDATDDGADIISMSIGGGGSTTEENAVNYAWNNGVVLVAAAGNDGGSNSVDCPACYASVIAVAALDSSGNRASYSDAGAQVEIAAPGSNVWSTYNGANNDYDSLSGTSMATPHVAGALALAWGCAPGLTNAQLRTHMQNTAQDKGSAGRDTIYGFGLLRVDSLVSAVGPCGGGGGNNAPTASFTHSESGLTVSVNGGASSDPDGDTLSYSWTFGDGGTGSGATASHTYASAGTYTVTLTVNDGNGGTDSASASVTVSSGGGGSGCGADPDPSVTALQDGQGASLTVAAGQWAYRKICVPGDATSLSVVMTGPSCGILGCSSDADLYTREGAKPTSSTYACRPYQSGSSESCSHTITQAGWWFVGVYGYSGSTTVTVTADHNGAGTPPTNNAPTASFTHGESGLTVSVNGGASSDPDGDTLSYAWTFGDGGTGSGATASHTYASAGTYTVTLTVNDGNGGTDSASASVTVTAPPSGCSGDPGVTVLDSGTTYSATLSSGQWAYGAICVTSGDDLDVVMTGPSCGLFGCSFDADLYVKAGSQPTASSYDCRPYQSGNSESCSFTNASAGWWYVGINAYSGSGTVQVTATTS